MELTMNNNKDFNQNDWIDRKTIHNQHPFHWRFHRNILESKTFYIEDFPLKEGSILSWNDPNFKSSQRN